MSNIEDIVYRSVADQRRRCILTYLRNADNETARFDDLVEYIIEEEPNTPPSDHDTIRIDLYHVHLPLLADAGVVEFDNRSETVRYRPHSKIETILDNSTLRSPDEAHDRREDSKSS